MERVERRPESFLVNAGHLARIWQDRSSPKIKTQKIITLQGETLHFQQNGHITLFCHGEPIGWAEESGAIYGVPLITITINPEASSESQQALRSAVLRNGGSPCA